MFLKINYTQIDFICSNNQYIIKTNEKISFFIWKFGKNPIYLHS
ncbi:Hypothetical protein Ccan_07720 [Capnocytophaga canimorsus Cc5]|uniref:Uncharacterized protein n=1 Tax=Capnocytophaga canimorsus (strain 5) TaxID=860228 RepID=F9YTV6_CAPCC|nr:Hypothetical protein Ccan_07720 [Capnocytophaga canimorsus Cc5]